MPSDERVLWRCIRGGGRRDRRHNSQIQATDNRVGQLDAVFFFVTCSSV